MPDAILRLLIYFLILSDDDNFSADEWSPTWEPHKVLVSKTWKCAFLSSKSHYLTKSWHFYSLGAARGFIVATGRWNQRGLREAAGGRRGGGESKECGSLADWVREMTGSNLIGPVDSIWRWNRSGLKSISGQIAKRRVDTNERPTAWRLNLTQSKEFNKTKRSVLNSIVRLAGL